MERSTSSFNPTTYSDLPLYNIQAVSSATGVPAITLRSWERRYGIPQPQRDDKGHRLYSERDIAVVRWLKDRVQQGVGISRAVNMLHALEGERLSQPEQSALNLELMRNRLLEAAMRMDDISVSRIVAEGLMVASVEEVAVQLIQPVLYEVGHRWAEGNLSVTVEHFAANLLRGLVAQLVRISPAPIRDDKIIVGCAPGELHDIGALILTLYLRRRGFDVAYIGANVEPDDFVADVLRVQPAAVLISASQIGAMRNVSSLLERLSQEYKGVLVYGGYAFDQHPDLIGTLPGLFLGRDAAEAVPQIEAEIARHPGASSRA